MSRHPATPDCGIRDCTRAEYRGGLCRMHFYLVAPDTRRRRAYEQMMDAHSRARASKAALVADVQAWLDTPGGSA